MTKNKVDLSVCVTAHAEGVLLHKTLKSIELALKRISNLGLVVELLVHADNPTAETKSYIQRSELLKELKAKVVESSFGDLGSSRNKCVTEASGKFITFIDADDLMSEYWLLRAYEHLLAKSSENEICKYIAHSEFTIEFEGANTLITKHGEIDRDTDTLLSVYANRWNSIIMIDREYLLKNQYSPNSTGYGYEDWNLNCRTIYSGMHNVLIPQTAIFVRRKKTNSEWARQIQSNNVLRSNPLLSFANFRDINIKASSINVDRSLAKKIITKYPSIHRIVKKARSAQPLKSISIPPWLKKEWLFIHTYEKNVFLDESSLVSYDTITPEHYQAGRLYYDMVKQATRDYYDYLIFVPWLLKGGADLYAINYANTILKLNPGVSIAVISTLNINSPWKHKLSKGVDFVSFGEISDRYSNSIKQRVMEQFVENSGSKIIHIINSEFAYDFVENHKAYIKGSGMKVILSSFSQSVDRTGRVYGYSHTHVPAIYSSTAFITSDNQAVLNMWLSEYGFDQNKLLLHRQPITLEDTELVNRVSKDNLKILWAARISPEKSPEIVPRIANLIQKLNITIDMYGSIDKEYEHGFINSLPSNIKYCGQFDGFKSLNPKSYDVYLYTSLFDGMPNSLLEAGSNKMAILASDVGGIPELIIDNETGLLIKDVDNPSAYAEAIMKLYENTDIINKFGENIYKKIESDFSMRQYDDSVKHMLREVGLKNEKS